MRIKERIPVVLKLIDWCLFLKHIEAKDFDINKIKDKIDSNELTEYWNSYPDLRLVQVLVNMNLIDSMNGFKYYVEETDYLIDVQKIKPEKILFWGTRGKDGKGDVKYIALENLESTHIENILKTQNLKGEYFSILRQLLRKRKLYSIDKTQIIDKSWVSKFRKGDLVEVSGKKIKLTSEPYEDKLGNVFYDTDSDKPISYTKLWKKGKLLKNN